jgi:hypothetical protein
MRIDSHKQTIEHTKNYPLLRGNFISTKYLAALKNKKRFEIKRYIRDKNNKDKVVTFWDEMNELLTALGDSTESFEGINNAWLNEPAYVIGASQALLGIDLSYLEGRHTITVNHLIDDWDKAEYHLFVDQRFIQNNKYDLSNFNGTIFQKNDTTFLKDVKRFIRFVPRNVKNKPVSNRIEEGLYDCQSGIAALNLAIISGANPIYLIGHDSTTLDKSRGDHFKTTYTGSNVKGNYNAYEEKKQFWFSKFMPYKDRIINICDPKIAFSFNGYFKTMSFDELKIKEGLNEKNSVN